VTGYAGGDAVNSHWTVVVDERCARAQSIACGKGHVRLAHTDTGALLVSTTRYHSALAHAQEVAVAYVDNDEADWTVECSTDYWQRGANVRLRHNTSGMYLAATGNVYGSPIRGQIEVSIRRISFAYFSADRRLIGRTSRNHRMVYKRGRVSRRVQAMICE
jgi:hypothetical protein